MSPSHTHSPMHANQGGARPDHAHAHRGGAATGGAQPARHEDDYDDGLVHGHAWASSAMSRP